MHDPRLDENLLTNKACLAVIMTLFSSIECTGNRSAMALKIILVDDHKI